MVEPVRIGGTCTGNQHYAMVRAQFERRFERATAPPTDVTVDSTFILHTKDGVTKIIFQHDAEDFWQMLRMTCDGSGRLIITRATHGHF